MTRTRSQATCSGQHNHSGYKHHDTPKKARIQGACEYLQLKGHTGFHNDVFKTFGVSKRQGWEIIKEGSSSRTFHNNSEFKETRGRPAKLSPDEIHEMERIIETRDAEGRSITWDTLGYEAGVDVSPRTIQRAMGRLDYHKCIACRKGWVSDDLAQRRLGFAQLMLQRYPLKKDWKHVRFSDEVHFGLGPQGKLRIIRKPGERYCRSCIQEADEPDDSELKKVHAWAAAGYGFKSELVFYDIDSNKNGKMTQKAYIEKILDPVVKPWIQRHPHFVLEEDRDSGHGTGDKNIVKTWKADNKLESYFNCSGSPDLAIIENCWQPMKQYVRKFSHWEPDDTKQLAYEGWDTVKQQWIDKQVNSIPQRLRDVIAAEGRMTGW